MPDRPAADGAEAGAARDVVGRAFDAYAGRVDVPAGNLLRRLGHAWSARSGVDAVDAADEVDEVGEVAPTGTSAAPRAPGRS
jgi:hypothetical protein